MVINRQGKIHALSGIRTHGLSIQALKAYASDRAADGITDNLSRIYYQLTEEQTNLSPDCVFFCLL
jgi:hypothetical protein